MTVHLHELQLRIALCRCCEHEPYGAGEPGLGPRLCIINLKVDNGSVTLFGMG